MYYSPSTGGFYDEAIHGARLAVRVTTDPDTGEVTDQWTEPNPDCKIPADAIEVSKQLHATLMASQAAGKVIRPGPDGLPVAVDPPAPSAEVLAAIAERARMAAYSKEADPLYFKWQRGEATKAEWIAKIDEIKARYPGAVGVGQ